jgi:hypothetical protein
MTLSIKGLKVHEGLFSQQQFLGFTVFRIVNTAVYRTDGSALRLVVKANTFSAFGVCDVVHFHAAGVVFLFRIYAAHSGVLALSFEPRSFSKFPACASFVNGVVWTFWLACTAVDAFISNHYGHLLFLLLGAG